MKKTTLAPMLILIGLMATLNFGCKKNEAPAAEQNSTTSGQTNSVIVSAEKTSFNEVTSELDPAGNFYLYLGTAQWLDGLSTKVLKWQQVFESMPQLKDEDRAMLTRLSASSPI